MKVKLFVALAVVGAMLVLYSLYVPWLSFNGLIRRDYKVYEVSGSARALGIGTLDRTSAKVTDGQGNTGLPLEATFGSDGCLSSEVFWSLSLPSFS